MMVALLLYGYATGVYSSRGLERATVEDVAVRVLAAGAQPHFTTINQFRSTHREALAGLFVQVLVACQSAGLVKLGHVAIDGTKMKANARASTRRRATTGWSGPGAAARRSRGAGWRAPRPRTRRTTPSTVPMTHRRRCGCARRRSRR
ncbi:MAG: transposase [Kofleriaceae bacterium]|nr:transposase [Kofleriaceae bacterium]